MRAEIVPYIVQDGKQCMQMHSDFLGVEDCLIALSPEEPHLLYVPEGKNLEDETMVLLAGNVKLTFTIEEWQTTIGLTDRLIEVGRTNRQAVLNGEPSKVLPTI